MDKRQNSQEATALVKGGSALMRVSNESMEMIAIQRPRVIEVVKTKALAEIKAFPELADRYYYSLPRRSKKCDHPTTQSCSTCVYIEGPSVHCALALARYWGNCSSEWVVESETEDHVYIKGIFQDFESNARFGRTIRVSKKTEDGRRKYQDALTMAVNAGGSKAQRNAILSAVPDPLKILLWTTAKELVMGDAPDQRLTQAQLQGIEIEFGKWDVSMETLERKLAAKRSTWTMANRATLVGLLNALRDGEASEKLFGSQVKKTKGKPAPVVEPKKKAAPEPEPEPEPEEEEPGEEVDAEVEEEGEEPDARTEGERFFGDGDEEF